MLESRLFGNHATKFKALFRPKNHHFCSPDIHQDTENHVTEEYQILLKIELNNIQVVEKKIPQRQNIKRNGLRRVGTRNKCYERF